VPNLETICCGFTSRGGLQLAEDVAALISLLGLALTIFVPPEAKGRTLESLAALRCKVVLLCLSGRPAI
jgi:hypothetical protein